MSAVPSATEARPRFLNVAEAARLVRVDSMTLYRAIRAGQFPAIKIRGRYVIPVAAVDAMESAAIGSGGMVDAADWTVSRRSAA